MLYIFAAGPFVMLCLAMLWYLPLIMREKVHPVPATWIIAATAMNLSAISAFLAPGRTILENVTLYAAAIEITIVLIVITKVLTQRGKWQASLDWFQWSCLAVMVIAVVRWFLGDGGPTETFWTTQGLLIIAYIVMVVKVWQIKKAFDSVGNWVFVFLGSLSGLPPAILAMGEQAHGIYNSTRSILSAGTTVFLLLYFDSKNEWSGLKTEIQTNKQVYKRLLRGGIK